MFKFYAILSLLIAGVSSSFSLAKDKPDFKLVRNRVISELMLPAVDDASVKELVENIRNDGSWENINYEDVSRTAFEHHIHMENLLSMSRAYKKATSSFYKDNQLKTAINSGLDYWIQHDFICENWWWNQIGIPNRLVSMLLIMDKDLSKEKIIETQPILTRANINASGARPSGDRIKIAGLQAKNALLIKDAKQFDTIIEVIEGEIKFAEKRGMQYDYSFHHRLDRVNNTVSYGKGYAEAFAEWAAYVNGTMYEFADEKIKQLIDYYLDGICKHMVYGKYPDPGVKNRSISRQEALDPETAETPKKLLQTGDYRSYELEEIVRIREGLAEPELSHSTFYWHSEHYTHQRPDYFTSVRMYSTRNHNMERPYNSEGLLNHHRGDGTNHLSIRGDEYRGIWPVYDWQKIPGTTIVQKPSLPSEDEIQKSGITEFVGAVTDGRYGAAVFDFRSLHDPLVAKKAWFFFDREYVCLGAGINSNSEYPVATTLNQCLLKEKVVVSADEQSRVLDTGDHETDNADWVWHDGIGYIFPGPARIRLSNKAATGSWYVINKQIDSPREKVTEDVFTVWLDHGINPTDGSYQYIVFPSIGLEGMEEQGDKSNIRILSNTSEIQAVSHQSLNICQIIFHRAGFIRISDRLTLSSDSPAAIMLRTDGNTISEISASDPSRKLGKIHLTVDTPVNKKSGENFRNYWNFNKGYSEISIDLPSGNYAGQTVTIQTN